MNTGLLRNELDFEGVLIPDALDMMVPNQGNGQVVDAIVAICSGVDPH